MSRILLSCAAIAAVAVASPPATNPASKITQMSGWVSLCAFSAPPLPLASSKALHRARSAACVRPRLAPAMLRMQQQGMPSSGRGQPGFIAPDQGKLLDSIVSLPSAGERKTMLKEQYQLLDNDGIGTVVERAEKEGDVWAEMLEELKSMTTERMLQGRDLLNDMLASGEINILDRKIVENVKAGKIDPAFLQVLELNIASAEGAGQTEDNTQLKVLAHVYTRVQEELEKQIEPPAGLLHRLLRNQDQNVRANILDAFLKPLPEEDRDMVFVDGAMTVSSGAKVEPMAFSAAMVAYLNKVREGPFGEEDVGQTFEDCRVIAKEARVCVELHWDRQALDEFTESLTPVFQPIMSTLEKYRKE